MIDMLNNSLNMNTQVSEETRGEKVKEHSEVIWYQRECEEPNCTYKTLRSTDPAAYQWIVADMESHMKIKHAQSGAKDTADNNAARRSYIEATKPRTVPEGIDNRCSMLHAWRTQPGPLDHTVAVKMQPIVQSPMYCFPDFTPMGVRVANEKTMEALHDRSNHANSNLQRFSSTNLSMKKDELKRIAEGENFVAMESIGEAVLAVDNFHFISKWIHPQDWGTKSIQRLILEKYTKQQISDVSEVTDFFTVAVTENCNRAHRKEKPLTFDELSIKWEQVAGAPRLNKRQSEIDRRRQIATEQQIRELKMEIKEMRGRKRPNTDTLDRPMKRFKKGSSGFCPDFNSLQGCPNDRTPSGCTKNGKEFKHGCSVMKDGVFCNDKSHNRHSHE